MNIWMATFLRYRGDPPQCTGRSPACAAVPACGDDAEAFAERCGGSAAAAGGGSAAEGCSLVPGTSQFLEAGPYVVAAALAVAVAIQLRAINSGLRTEGALTFVPIKSALNVAQV